jgi:predicted nucleotidyltransferase component of viral defense system
MGPADKRRGGGVITSREVADAANEWQLRHDVVEKDYVLGWLLAAIAEHPVTGRWAFKGGTCLRKCWFETYRFSEDLDFTVGAQDLEIARLAKVFGEIADWLHDRSGLVISLDSASFRPRKNKRGEPTIQGRITYNGPLASPSPPKVKLDLTADEVLVRPLERRPVSHPFSDRDANGIGAKNFAEVLSYSLPELMGEKLRALAQRCRPRDLYDVVHMHRHPDLAGLDHEVRAVLDAKCAHAGIETPTLESMWATVFRAEIEAEWDNMLGHQLPFLPQFDGFWSELDEVFAWLGGRSRAPFLEPFPVSRDVTPWLPARHMTTWRSGAPLEVIRFAGANRLKVVVDYWPERGRIGPRVVEPYSLRRTRDGHLLLFVRNDQGQLRSYRVDRIRAARIQRESFTPRYRIDF